MGYCYPTDEPCPPVNLRKETPGTCALGPAPVYTINATEPAELAAGMAFARKNNIRLVVRNTGHDILGKYVVFLPHLWNVLTVLAILEPRGMVHFKSGSSISRREFLYKINTGLPKSVFRVTGPARRSQSVVAMSGQMCMSLSSSAALRLSVEAIRYVAK